MAEFDYDNLFGEGITGGARRRGRRGGAVSGGAMTGGGFLSDLGIPVISQLAGAIGLGRGGAMTGGAMGMERMVGGRRRGGAATGGAVSGGAVSGGQMLLGPKGVRRMGGAATGGAMTGGQMTHLMRMRGGAMTGGEMMRMGGAMSGGGMGSRDPVAHMMRGRLADRRAMDPNKDIPATSRGRYGGAMTGGAMAGGGFLSDLGIPVISQLAGAIGLAKPRRGRRGGAVSGGAMTGGGDYADAYAGGAMTGGAMAGGGFMDDVGNFIGNVGKAVGPFAPLLMGLGKKKRAPAGPNDGRRKRAEIVRRVMQERGVSLPEASRIVKSEGLY